jgi:flavin reductase (DIM6/NTAB) family NADH-FMN oxidoreductase RutF
MPLRFHKSQQPAANLLTTLQIQSIDFEGWPAVAEGGMQFVFHSMKPMERYELLLGTILPRPIAIVTTLSADGALNAAPYSLFNAVSHDPPVIMIAVLPHPAGRLKDTAANIFATREFVVNLVPRSMAEAMNITNIDAPQGANELALAGLLPAPSVSIKPPRIAGSPVSYECRLLNALSFNSHQAVIFGEVVTAFISDDFVIDATHAVVDTPRLDLFGAMHAARWYCAATDWFEMVRPTWAQWVTEGKV